MPLLFPYTFREVPMASRMAHVATGWAAGVMAAAVVSHAGAAGPYYVWCIAALIAGIAGGCAPDSLERRWWSPKGGLWVRHRTITHWGLGWLSLLFYSYHLLPKQHWAAALFGYAVGGVMHLTIDFPNPMGVPWVYRRRSLNLWASGERDYVVIAGAWIAALVLLDILWFKAVHIGHLVRFVRSLPVFA